MKLFENGVGRPSNETIRKRRIIYGAIAVVCLSVIIGAIFLVTNTFLAQPIEGVDKNAKVSAKPNKFAVQALDNNCIKVYAPTNANYWRIQLSYNNKTYKQVDHYKDGKKEDTICFEKQKTTKEKHKISLKWTKGANNRTQGSVLTWKPSGWIGNIASGWGYKYYSIDWKNSSNAVYDITKVPNIQYLGLGDTAEPEVEKYRGLAINKKNNDYESWKEEILPKEYLYEVYYATSKTGSYNLLKTSKTDQVTFSIPLGKTYYIKARLCKIVSNKKTCGKYSNVLGFDNVEAPTIERLPIGDTARDSKDELVGLGINYIEIDEGFGSTPLFSGWFYEVYYATSKTGKYKLLKTTKTDYVDFLVPQGKTYYVKARLCTNVKTKKTCGGYSNIMQFKNI